jgi:hypothetical protein
MKILTPLWSSFPIGDYFDCKCRSINIRWGTKCAVGGDQMLWRNLKKRREEVSIHYGVSSNQLEVGESNNPLRCVSVMITPSLSLFVSTVAGIDLTAILNSGHRNLPTQPLYFHRRYSSIESAREFWGFFSLDSDPMAPTGLSDDHVDYTM